jgi:Fe-S cluster assembly iron-binding protein IscA
MLQVTSEATELLDAAKQAEGVPDTFGVRVYGAPTEGGEVQVRIGFTDQPQEGDSVTEQQGTRLFVAPEIVDSLSDAMIDRQGTKLVIQQRAM